MLDLKAVPRRGVRTLAVVGCALAAWLSAAEVARADIAIAADVETLVPIEYDNIDPGPGFGIRLGAQIHLPLITLTPEIGFTWASFGDGPEIYRGILGARVGLGEVLRFGVFAHLGFGHQSWELATVDVSHTGVTMDAGLFLDLTIIPLIDVGVHMGYGRLSANEDENIDPNQWLAFGLHAAIVF